MWGLGGRGEGRFLNVFLMIGQSKVAQCNNNKNIKNICALGCIIIN